MRRTSVFSRLKPPAAAKPAAPVPIVEAPVKEEQEVEVEAEAVPEVEPDEPETVTPAEAIASLGGPSESIAAQIAAMCRELMKPIASQEDNTEAMLGVLHDLDYVDSKLEQLAFIINPSGEAPKPRTKPEPRSVMETLVVLRCLAFTLPNRARGLAQLINVEKLSQITHKAVRLLSESAEVFPEIETRLHESEKTIKKLRVVTPKTELSFLETLADSLVVGKDRERQRALREQARRDKLSPFGNFVLDRRALGVIGSTESSRSTIEQILGRLKKAKSGGDSDSDDDDEEKKKAKQLRHAAAAEKRRAVQAELERKAALAIIKGGDREAIIRARMIEKQQRANEKLRLRDKRMAEAKRRREQAEAEARAAAIARAAEPEAASPTSRGSRRGSASPRARAKWNVQVDIGEAVVGWESEGQPDESLPRQSVESDEETEEKLEAMIAVETDPKVRRSLRKKVRLIAHANALKKSLAKPESESNSSSYYTSSDESESESESEDEDDEGESQVPLSKPTKLKKTKAGEWIAIVKDEDGEKMEITISAEEAKQVRTENRAIRAILADRSLLPEYYTSTLYVKANYETIRGTATSPSAAEGAGSWAQGKKGRIKHKKNMLTTTGYSDEELASVMGSHRAPMSLAERRLRQLELAKGPLTPLGKLTGFSRDPNPSVKRQGSRDLMVPGTPTPPKKTLSTPKPARSPAPSVSGTPSTKAAVAASPKKKPRGKAVALVKKSKQKAATSPEPAPTPKPPTPPAAEPKPEPEAVEPEAVAVAVEEVVPVVVEEAPTPAAPEVAPTPVAVEEAPAAPPRTASPSLTGSLGGPVDSSGNMMWAEAEAQERPEEQFSFDGKTECDRNTELVEDFITVAKKEPQVADILKLDPLNLSSGYYTRNPASEEPSDDDTFNVPPVDIEAPRLGLSPSAAFSPLCVPLNPWLAAPPSPEPVTPFPKQSTPVHSLMDVMWDEGSAQPETPTSAKPAVDSDVDAEEENLGNTASTTNLTVRKSRIPKLALRIRSMGNLAPVIALSPSARARRRAMPPRVPAPLALHAAELVPPPTPPPPPVLLPAPGPNSNKRQRHRHRHHHHHQPDGEKKDGDKRRGSGSDHDKDKEAFNKQFGTARYSQFLQEFVSTVLQRDVGQFFEEGCEESACSSESDSGVQQPPEKLRPPILYKNFDLPPRGNSAYRDVVFMKNPSKDPVLRGIRERRKNRRRIPTYLPPPSPPSPPTPTRTTRTPSPSKSPPSQPSQPTSSTSTVDDFFLTSLLPHGKKTPGTRGTLPLIKATSTPVPSTASSLLTFSTRCDTRATDTNFSRSHGASHYSLPDVTTPGATATPLGPRSATTVSGSMSVFRSNASSGLPPVSADRRPNRPTKNNVQVSVIGDSMRFAVVPPKQNIGEDHELHPSFNFSKAQSSKHVHKTWSRSLQTWCRQLLSRGSMEVLERTRAYMADLEATTACSDAFEATQTTTASTSKITLSRRSSTSDQPSDHVDHE